MSAQFDAAAYDKVIPLSPPLVVSGTVMACVEDSFDFTNGLAVLLTMTIDSDDVSNPYYDYTVVMPNGRVYEVNDSLLTSAAPLITSDHPQGRDSDG